MRKILGLCKNLEALGTQIFGLPYKIWGDKRFGFLMIIKGPELFIGLFLIIVFFVKLIIFLINLIKSSRLPFLFFPELVLIFCQYNVFKVHEYLRYFDSLQNCLKAEIWKYILLIFAFLEGNISLLLNGLRFLTQDIQKRFNESNYYNFVLLKIHENSKYYIVYFKSICYVY
jgi:hypothetical protein